MAEVPQQAYPVSPVRALQLLTTASYLSSPPTAYRILQPAVYRFFPTAGNESTFTGNNVSAFTTLFKLSNTGLTASCAITDEDKIIANVNNEM